MASTPPFASKNLSSLPAIPADAADVITVAVGTVGVLQSTAVETSAFPWKVPSSRRSYEPVISLQPSEPLQADDVGNVRSAAVNSEESESGPL